MYELDLYSPGAHIQQPSALTTRSQNKPTDLEMWHHQLGHIGKDAICLLSSRSLVEGLKITNKTTSGMCEDCIFRKQARRPFDKVMTPETQVLE